MAGFIRCAGEISASGNCNDLVRYQMNLYSFERSPPPAYIYRMKRWGRVIFIFVAYGLALLHTAVPHHHAASRTGETIITHTGCLFDSNTGSLLQRALSTDLGVGHLETFKKGGGGSELDVTVPFTAALAVFVPLPISSVKLVSVLGSQSGYIEKFHKRLLLFSTAHFRAPPQLI